MPKQNSRSLLTFTNSHTFFLSISLSASGFCGIRPSSYPSPRVFPAALQISRVSCPTLVRKYPSTAPQAASFGRLLTSFWELKTISRFQVYRYANATTYMLTGSKRSKLRPNYINGPCPRARNKCITRCRLRQTPQTIPALFASSSKLLQLKYSPKTR